MFDDSKKLRSPQLLSRWIIVEEDVSRHPMANTKEAAIETNVSGHFDNKDMAVCSLDGLLEEETKLSPKEDKKAKIMKYKVFTQPGFMFKTKERSHYRYIASLH